MKQRNQVGERCVLCYYRTVFFCREPGFYDWKTITSSETKEKGAIIFGEYPHEYYPDLYNENNRITNYLDSVKEFS